MEFNVRKSLQKFFSIISFSVILGFCFSSVTFAGTSVESTIHTSVNSSCQLSALSSSTISGALDPGTAGEIGSVYLGARCNDGGGWALYVAGNGSGSSKTSLVHTTNSSNTIATGTTFSGSTSAWGLKASVAESSNYTSTIDYASSYATVPSSNTKLASMSSGTDVVLGAVIKTDYKAFVSSTQASGSYQGKVKYILVHPQNASVPFGGISTMQEMTSTICSNASEGTTAELTDSRDGKTYTVAKLADGNCWMTQNLALGGSSAITLTSSDSDVSSNFTLPASTTSWYGDGQEYGLYNPYDNQDDDINRYGTYYSWSTAVAGTDISANEATGSVCPKGWSLPTSEQGDNLYVVYGAVFDEEFYESESFYLDEDLPAKMSSLNPVYSGYLDAYDSDSRPSYVGDSMQLWQSTSSNSDATAFNINLDGDFYPSATDVKSTGRPVRCVAR